MLEVLAWVIITYCCRVNITTNVDPTRGNEPSEHYNKLKMLKNERDRGGG